MGRLLVMTCIGVMLSFSTTQAAWRGRVLLLDVRINGHAIGMIGEFHARGDRMYATRRELTELGMRTPAGTDDSEVSLGDLPGVTWRMDGRAQMIAIAAAEAALIPRELGPDPDRHASAPVLQSAIGAVLNYDIEATREVAGGARQGGGQTLAEALLEARVFSPWGVLQSDAIATSGGGGDAGGLTRLDTSYSFADAGSLLRVRLGDLVSGGLGWTRPVRLGGGQVSTDFATRPDLVTFPVPAIAGDVAVPSSVDVLVDGVQVLSRDVPPGPFEIRQLPVVTGAGDIDVVTRDADGRQTRRSLPIYASNLLLAPGLQAGSIEIGSVRLDAETPGDSYHGAAASASYRRGVLEWLTLEAHGEATLPAHVPWSELGDVPGDARGPDGSVAGGAMLGGGGGIGLGRLGAVSVAVAASSFGRRRGSLGSVAYERLGRLFNLAGSLQLASRAYRDVAGAFGDAPPLMQARASVGCSLGRFGSVGAAYVGLRRGTDVAQAGGAGAAPGIGSAFGLTALAAPRAPRLSLVSASYSTTVLHGAAFVFANGFAELAGSHGAGLLLGATVPFGTRGSVSGGVERGNDGLHGNIGASQSANAIGDVGWRLLDQTGTPSRQLASGDVRTPVALLGAGVDRSGGLTAVRGSVQGALTFADGGLFASNTIRDSFAIVDTGATPAVPVLQDNRPVGHTDGDGRLLVTDLRGLQDNRLDIDPRAVPMDAQIGPVTQMIRPRELSGVIVHFPIRVSRGAVVRLVDAAGADIAVGSGARLLDGGGSAGAAEVGFGGEAFMTGLAAQNRVEVTMRGGGRCRAIFGYHPTGGGLPHIGPIRCLPVAA